MIQFYVKYTKWQERGGIILKPSDFRVYYGKYPSANKECRYF